MEFLSLKNIRELHVEITNLCNAACPMCARNDFGFGVRENPGLSGWSAGDAELAFSPDLVNLERVFFCGTHGDPLVSDQLLDAVRYCKSRNLVVEIFTNGSLRSAQWWHDLASTMGPSDKIIFGVDGIETNHLYRQNTKIEKILENMRICCRYPVTVQWDFLAFKHNEHELERCKEVAREIGVKKFRIRKTARWNMNDGNPVPARDRTGKITHYLEKPANPDLVHPDAKRIEEISSSLPSEYNIRCLYQDAAKMYVNSRMQVFPCCYISSDNEEMNINKSSESLLVPYWDFSLREKSWADILHHEFFREQLVRSFGDSSTLARCVRTCGVVKRETNQNQMVDI